MQQSLFDEMDTPISNSMDYSLKINTKAKSNLSKNQIQFNDLTHKIEFLENKIKTENEKLNNLLSVFYKKVLPLESEFAISRFKIAIALDAGTMENKFSKKQIENIRIVIISICDLLFQSVEPTEEQKALYNRWSDISYDEEIELRDQEQTDFFKDFFSSVLDEDFDINDFENNPEKYEQRLKEKLGHENQERPTKSRKKTTKQLEKESLLKAEQEAMTKSVRSIYLTLVKVLHPDLEADEVLRAEKEEIMKLVTTSYNQNDITTLLKLEMEWVHKTSEHLEKLTDDVLKVYISALKKQASELQHEYYMLFHNPKFEPISEFISMKEKSAINNILKKQKEIKSAIKNIESTCSVLNKSNSKKHIIEFVDEYKEYIEDLFYETNW